jgi:hypothetical protein
VNVNPVHPWELNASLQQDRLQALAKVAVATRNRAFAEADRAAGDTNWGLACKAHERLMYALGEMVSRGEHAWLGVVRDGLYLMPLVEGVPVRLYRGDPTRPSSRHLDALRLEHERARGSAPQMAFDFMGASSSDGPWYWLMAMETDAAGMVTRVVFVQANDAGETRNAWACPLDEPATPHAVEAAPPKTREVDAKSSAVVRLADKRRRAPKPDGGDRRQEGFWGALGAE